MSKNIIVLSDGTGQAFSAPGKGGGTNVYKLYRAIRGVSSADQVAFYDPGLGSDPDDDGLSWTRWGYNVLSQATGLGISRNIKDCYEALVQHYEPGDRIFLFGFSRGAYTVRSMAGALSLCGIPARDKTGGSVKTDAKSRAAAIEEAVEEVYKHYAASDDPVEIERARQERIRRGEAYRRDRGAVTAAPYFIGVWDTVRALGIPGLNWMLRFSHAFHNADLGASVAHARQALAIDETRDIFAPVLWSEPAELRASGRLKQLWLAGDHSDVGGGYAETGLSDLALGWMVDEACKVPQGLIIDQAAYAALGLHPDPLGVQHDPRRGLGLLWAKGVRRLSDWDRFAIDPVKARFLAASVPTEDGTSPYDPEGARSNTQAQTWIAQRGGA